MSANASKFPLPQAVSLFLAHLKKIGLSQTAFCAQKGLDRIAVQRAVNGERRRYTVDFALEIEAATEGAVPVKSWATRAIVEVAHRAPEPASPEAA